MTAAVALSPMTAMAWYSFDCETNGLLDTLDTVHCLVLKDTETGKVYDYSDAKYGTGSIERGLKRLVKAEKVIGHNIVKFDIPALTKVYPWFDLSGVAIEDTLIETRLIWPNVADDDMVLAKRGRFPGRLIGAHSLESWGYRLGKMKGEYGRDEKGKQLPGIWESWNQEMHDYCVQDVEVTEALRRHITKQNYSERAIILEHRFADIIARQERRGFAFDVASAQGLYAELVGIRLSISKLLAETFPPKTVYETFTPKVNNKKRGYVKGVPFTKTHIVTFNPSSRQMIADRLKEKGWVPLEFTPSGQPKIDETILAKLAYPEAKVLSRHFLVEKRIGQLAEGDQAWLRLESKGRIHGSVNTNGAVTGRCTHSNPNVAQVPKVQVGKVDGVKGPLRGEPGGWGWECRNLFRAGPGLALVGIDLSGIELRCLAHYMARYDGGDYGKAVVEGNSDDGTDVHSLNARALGLDPKASYVVFGKVANGRDIAKTFIYAFLYGAGDEKLGSIVGVSEEEAETLFRDQRQAWSRACTVLERQGRSYDKMTVATIVKGGLLKKRFLEATPALASLREAVDVRAKKNKQLGALDGRILHVRHSHAALNTLLQNAGALIAKQATIFAYDNLTTDGRVFEKDWALVAHIHDELQIECKEEIADEVGQTVIRSMCEAGEYFGFRVPVSGEYKVGKTWADTH